MAKGEVTIKINGDASSLEKALGGAERALGGFGAGAGKVLAGVATAVAGAFAVHKIVDFGASAISVASDINESLNKTQVLYGDFAASIDEAAKKAATSAGLSRAQYLDLAGTLGTFGKAAGLAGQDLAKFSEDIIARAADVGSFNNATTPEVIEAWGAALRGETEPMRRFGVLLDDASLRAKALEMGLIDNVKNALTPQQKALAANALIMEQTAVAAGDFANTSDGAANRQKILAAQLENVKAKIGTALLPAYNAVLGVIADKVIPALEKFADWLGPKLNAAFEIVQAAIRAFQTGGLQGLADFVDKLFGGNGSISRAIMITADAFKAAFQAIGDAISWVAGLFKSKGEGEMGGSASRLGSVIESVKDMVVSAFGAIRTTIETIVGIVTALWRQFGDNLVGFIKGAIDPILQIVNGFATALGGIFDLIKAILTGKWGDAWDALKKIGEGVKDAIIGQFRFLKEQVELILGVVAETFGKVWEGLKKVAGTLFDGVEAAFRGVVNGMIGAVEGALNILIKGINKAIDGLNIINPFEDIPKIKEVTLPRVRAMGGPTEGWTIVGERGPEAVRLPKGSEVVPNHALTTSDARIVVNVTTNADPFTIAREVAWVLQTSGR